MYTTYTKETRCTKCGTVLNMVSLAGGGASHPEPGDVSICFYCHHMMMFGEEEQLRDITDEELAELIEADEWAELIGFRDRLIQAKR